MPSRKTLYQLLGVTDTAPLTEIVAAFQAQEAALRSREHGLSDEDAEARLKAARLAYEVLSDNSARRAYDTKLATRQGQCPRSNPIVPIIETLTALDSARPPKALRPFVAMLSVIGLVLLIGIMLLVFRGMSDRTAENDVFSDAAARKRAEKVLIQEYYQNNGVRPGSREETDLQELAARNARARKVEEERKRADDERRYQQFVRDGRQRGENVSAELMVAEEAARWEGTRRRERDRIVNPFAPSR